jgi:hypothetical protein
MIFLGYKKSEMSTDRESGRGNKRARVTRYDISLHNDKILLIVTAASLNELFLMMFLRLGQAGRQLRPSHTSYDDGSPCTAARVFALPTKTWSTT